MRCSACTIEIPGASRFCLRCGARVGERTAVVSGKPDALEEGTEIAPHVEGRYRVLRLLGRGGMGAVYLAREDELDRLVALKTLRMGDERSEDARERFRREARAAARLNHPGIVPLHAYGETQSAPYYVMGYVRGESLAARLDRDGRIPAEEARELLATLADALDYAHRKGVVHRDVKPENVLLDDETGRPLLTDFGIARLSGATGTLTAAGSLIGTPHYMSPEQAAGRPAVDGRSDLYSLGLIGFRMLAGRLPFEGASLQESLVRRMTQDVPALRSTAPDVPEDLAAAVDRCLLRDPAARWPDGRGLRGALGGGANVGGVAPALEGVESLVFWFVPMALAALAVLALLRAYGAQALFVTGGAQRWNVPIVPLVGVLIALIPLQRLLATLGSGLSLGQVARAAFWPPRGWALWYPAALRRPHDLWPRLPSRVRRFRTLLTAMLVFAAGPLGLLVSLGLLFSSEDFSAERFNMLLLLLGAPLVFVFPPYALLTLGVGWRLSVWARANGLSGDEARRLLQSEPTLAGVFWARPAVKQLLDREAPRPMGPRAHLDAIAAAARSESGPARAVGSEALEAARLLLAGIAPWARHWGTTGASTRAGCGVSVPRPVRWQPRTSPVRSRTFRRCSSPRGQVREEDVTRMVNSHGGRHGQTAGASDDAHGNRRRIGPRPRHRVSRSTIR